MSAHCDHAASVGKPDQPQSGPAKHGDHYLRLGLMMLVSFVAMYWLMYAMVDRAGNVFASWNQVYMAGVMTGAMLVIELALMWRMYPKQQANVALLAIGIVITAACWFGIREQAGIGDRQFLRSMIPHHAGAILMCEEAQLTDPEVRALCAGIISGQEAEIAQMKALLEKPQ
jgi:hypothetical protein